MSMPLRLKSMGAKDNIRQFNFSVGLWTAAIAGVSLAALQLLWFRHETLGSVAPVVEMCNCADLP